MRDDGIELIHSFVIVAQELSFRRSAEILNIDRSALTRRIKKLEEINGFPLFERTTREVCLTPAGRTLFDSSIDLLRDYTRATDTARRIAEGKSGRLRIAYMAFAAPKLMPVAVARFQREHPDVDITLRYIGTQRQKVSISHGEIDVGYMIGPFDHSDYACLLVKSEPLYAVMPHNHPLTRKFEITPQDICRHDLILGDLSEWEFYRWRLNELFSSQGLQFHIKQEASNALALIGLVAAGFGITVFPESLAETLAGPVTIHKIAHDDFKVETVLVWNRLNRSRIVSDFVSAAKAVIPAFAAGKPS